MPIVIMFLLILALVLFVLAGLGIPQPSRFGFIGFGLAAITLAEILLHMPAAGAGYLH